MKGIRQKRIDLTTLKLSPEEGFVLSRVDGDVSVRDLVALTGLDEGRIVDIVGRLSAEGALEVDGGATASPPQTSSSSSSSSFGGIPAQRAPVVAKRAPQQRQQQEQQTPPQQPQTSNEASEQERIDLAQLEEVPEGVEPEGFGVIDEELLDFLKSDATQEATAEGEGEAEGGGEEGEGEGEGAGAEDGQPRASRIRPNREEGELDPAPKTEDAPAAEEEAATEEGAEGEEKETDAELTEKEAKNEADYRKIYSTFYLNESRDVRVKSAQEVTGPDLLALCFDPDPQVIHALLTNPHAGLPHARMIAFHHRTQMGLEAVAKRVDYLKDSLVQRRLLRNPLLPTTILNRIMNPKMLQDIYKVAIDREIPERTRVLVRDILRKKFMLASSDEKAALLFKTEGRCLVLLIACSLDMHATAILCSKTSFTILFIQNLARWSATPPSLLAHLLKLQVVRRNVGLAKMILKHPNTPSEAKKNFIR